MTKSSKKTVLLVDDEPMIRDVLKDILCAFDIDIFESSDGHAACQIITSNKIDLVVSDINMPGQSGLKLISFCQSQTNPPAVFLISGNMEENEAQALSLGARCVFEKPINFKLFLSEAQKYLG